MAVSTAVDFRAEVQKLFDRFDRQEFDQLQEMFADDVQGVDEISRKWLRGKAATDGYFTTLAEAGVADIRSKVGDFDTRQWDDIALVTCTAEQSYTMGGDEVTIHAPVSVLFRRNRGHWQIQLIHAVPLPDVD